MAQMSLLGRLARLSLSDGVEELGYPEGARRRAADLAHWLETIPFLCFVVIRQFKLTY